MMCSETIELKLIYLLKFLERFKFLCHAVFEKKREKRRVVRKTENKHFDKKTGVFLNTKMLIDVLDTRFVISTLL